MGPDDAAIAVVKEIMKDHSAIIFGGNGYSKEWHIEAVERGLLNLSTTADALPILKEEYIKELFERTGVLSASELESLFEVCTEQYIQEIEMAAKIMSRMAKTMISPAVGDYLSILSTRITELKQIDIESKLEHEKVKTVACLKEQMMNVVTNLDDAIGTHNFTTLSEHMQHCAETLCQMMDEVRKYADALEGEVPAHLWPWSNYQEILCIK